MVLGFEDRHYRGIQLGFSDFSGADEFGEVLCVGLAGHVHVEAGADGLVGRVCRVLGKAVCLQALDGKCVRDDEAFEAPFLAQDVSEQPVIAGGWDVIQIHVCAHEASCAGFFGRVEGDEIDIAHEHFRNIRRVVVTTAVGSAVAREMLHARQHAIGPRVSPWNPRTCARAMAAPR